MQTFQKNHLNDFGYYELKARYELFLNKAVEKWMFVPCDEEGNVLDKPKSSLGGAGIFSEKYIDATEKYQQAKERVLFEYWTYDFEDEYLVFKIGDKIDEFFLDFEEIERLKLVDLVDEYFPFSQTALNQIYNNYETE